MSGYRGGHILRIKLKNFMTYDDLEIFPQHGLNLIIGLNGSGKSSIMCAICLGLGGKPQLTGRSGQLSDFVKYGCEQAIIEIELENSSKINDVITRIIEKNSSTWLLNNSSVSLDEIQKTVHNFNIDVSNLCQFLPQEKVKEFAMMDKKARLENMLQCIGDPYLLNTFKELKQLKIESIKLEEEMRHYQKNIEEEKQKIDRLKIEVDKHEEGLRLIEHLKSFEQLKLYVDYKNTKVRLDQSKKDKKSLSNSVERLDDEISLMNERITEKTQQLQATLEQLRDKKRKLVNIQKDILQKQQEIKTLHDKASNAKVLFENKVVEKKNQLEKLALLSHQKQELEMLYNRNLLERPDLEERDKALSVRLEEIKNTLSSLEPNKARIVFKINQLEQSIRKNTVEIEEMQKEENKKMEFLKEKFKDVYDAVLWVKDNKGNFNAPVYLPMLLVFSLENDGYRKLIENCLNENDLTAFVCENKDDFELLVQTLKVESDLKVNIVLAPEKSIEEYESPAISDELREMGVLGFMKDLFKVPNPILCFLCECYKLHMLPFCDTAEKNNIDLLLQNFHSIVTPDVKFVRKRSKYGDQHLSTRLDPIWESSFIPSSKDYSERLETFIEKTKGDQALVDTFASKLKEFQAEIEEVEKEENSLREEKITVQAKLKDICTYERQLSQKSTAYENKKEELVNEVLEKETVVNEVQEMCNTLFQKGQIIDQLTASFVEFYATMKEKLLCYLKARLIKKKLLTLREVLKRKEKQQIEVQKELDKAKENFNLMKQKGYELMADLIRLVPNENQTEDSAVGDVNSKTDTRERFKQVIPDIQKMFEPYVGYDEMDIDKEIHHVRAQMEICSEDTTAAFNEYNKRTQAVTGMEKEVETFKLHLKEMEKNMSRKKDTWLPELEKHINNINNKFSQFYAKLDCVGEVILDTCDNSDEFLNYGLQINLKYRDNEPLAELSKAHHSGGECSVAAIIFILSLQDLTEVPFRCIDEINQGMDERNERIIYDLIALSVNSEFCPQYFLLTPKLLGDLEMVEHKDIKVHVIFKSQFLHMNLDVRKHIELM